MDGSFDAARLDYRLYSWEVTVFVLISVGALPTGAQRSAATAAAAAVDVCVDISASGTSYQMEHGTI